MHKRLYAVGAVSRHENGTTSPLGIEKARGVPENWPLGRKTLAARYSKKRAAENAAIHDALVAPPWYTSHL